MDVAPCTDSLGSRTACTGAPVAPWDVVEWDRAWCLGAVGPAQEQRAHRGRPHTITLVRHRPHYTRGVPSPCADRLPTPPPHPE